MSIPRTRYHFILATMLIFISASAIADTSSSSPVFTAEQQLVLEKYTHGIDSKVGDVSNKLVLLEQKIDADNDAQTIKDNAKQAALDSQLALYKQESETKNTSLTLTREALEISQRSVDLWLGFLSLLLAAATFFVWRMRATIQQEWDKQKNQISAEHGAAIQDIDRSKEVLTREVKECLIEARERIKELREELNHARSINGDIGKIHDKAEATLISAKDNTPEQIDDVIRKNKAKADESAQSALVAIAMELEQGSDWEAASNRWLVLTELSPSNADYWFNYAYALYKSIQLKKSENNTNRLNLVCDAYRRVTVLDPSSHVAFYSLGILLGERANNLKGVKQQVCFKESVEMYYKASILSPNDADIYYHCGTVFLKWARTLENDFRDSTLLEAENVLFRALKLKPEKTYNLACLKTLQGEFEEARSFLEIAKVSGDLPDSEHLRADLDLENLHKLSWFQDLLAEVSELPESGDTVC
ncbi:tetratricopeptide repeat protein [Shewanella sp. YLB-07]|uniref:tetratricopeptide repeat protein n=1 Tax=Shewanella sp. YLB-07 TaxID=2601268 RepID=UPI00128D9855|nr:hypothetical protein [Shewanella sp. YLB-07]MPY25435.1 hypothetical protein [Shewanella sp. YLB-07]